MAAPQLPGWQAKLLAGIGAPVTPENELFVNDWNRAEGGGATNNPFNTTQPGYHSTGTYNSVGVQNYADPNSGLQATIHTLNNGRYGNILSALKSGKSAQASAQALANSPWGTGALVLKMLGGHVTAAPGGGVSSRDLAQSAVAQPQQASGDPRNALMSMLASNLSSYANTGHMESNPMQLQQFLAQSQEAPSTLPRAPGKVAQSIMVGAGNASGIAKTALTQLGRAYQWGGKAVLGGNTDCSGLLQASARANGINLARTTYDQFKQGSPVPLNQLQPGDAVFSEPTAQGPGHVSIYIGNGKLVEDPHTGASVRISTLAGRRGIVGARRY